MMFYTLNILLGSYILILKNCVFVITTSFLRKSSCMCQQPVEALLLFGASSWIQCCSWLLVLWAVCSWTWQLPIKVSLWETQYCVQHLRCIVLHPLWWGDAAVIWLISWRAGAALNIFQIYLDCPVFFVPAEIFFEYLTQSFVSTLTAREPGVFLCVCVCFNSAWWLTLAPVHPWVTTASDMTCQQLHSCPNTT